MAQDEIIEKIQEYLEGGDQDLLRENDRLHMAVGPWKEM